MTDSFGRRYLEVGPFSPAVQRLWKDIPPEECVECGKPVRHGFERYFQRNDKEDGTPEQVAALGGQEIAGILASLTYDTVCGPCGDLALGHPGSHLRPV